MALVVVGSVLTLIVSWYAIQALVARAKLHAFERRVFVGQTLAEVRRVAREQNAEELNPSEQLVFGGKIYRLHIFRLYEYPRLGTPCSATVDEHMVFYRGKVTDLDSVDDSVCF